MLLRCTARLLKVIGRDRVDLSAGPASDEDWYANLTWFDRRKCLLLTHAGTLFSVFEPDVTAARLRATRVLVADLVERELAAEGLPLDAFGALRDEELMIAPTADRSVLGCMNDMTILCDYATAGDGGLAHADVAELNRALRRNINRPRGYRRPIEMTRERVTTS